MSELSPKARALLEAARRDHGPNEEDRERVLTSLHVSLGIGAALPVLTDASAASASASGPQPVSLPPPPPSLPPPPPPFMVQPAASKALGWSKLLAWKAGKVYLATLVLGGSAVGVSMVPRGDDDAHARRSAAMVAPSEQRELPSAAGEAIAASEPGPAVERVQPNEEAVEPRAPEPRSATAERASALPAAVANEAKPAHEAVHEPREKVRVRSAKTEARPSTRALRSQARQVERRRAREERELLAKDNTPEPAKPVEAPATEDVASAVGVGSPPSPELALIRAALTSLRDRDSSQALRLLDEHAARYPNGAFSTERRALHVVALCAAGRADEGERERAQFLKTSGDSPIAARVRSACPR